MSFQTINWISTVKLPCSDCLPADVILCFPPEKIAQRLCTSSLAHTDFVWHTINASLIVVSQTPNQCGIPFYNYIFSFDDTQLVLDTLVTVNDILGVFCKGCLTNWVEDVAGEDTYIRDNEDGSQTLITEHGCEYNILTGNGGGTDFVVADTDSIDLTLTAGSPDVLTGDVKISAEFGNAISIQPDGLFAAGGASCPLDFVFGDGPDGSIHVMNGDDILMPWPARNYFWNNVNIDAGGILKPYGYFHCNLTGRSSDLEFYQIFVAGTLTINGTITADGLDAPNASGDTEATSACNNALVNPCTGGAPHPGGKGGFGADFLGGDGPGGGSDNGGDGGFGAAGFSSGANGCSPGNNRGSGAGYMGGGLGGSGGNGGNFDVGTVVGLGYPTASPGNGDFQRIRRFMHGLYEFSSGGSYIMNAVGGGSGGGGGGGGATQTGSAKGGGGGGGGGAGGSIYIAARHIIIGNTGVISAKGGKGGNGAAAVAGGGGDAADGGGGGGGGGGGLIFLIYESLTNLGSITVTGGAGGAGGAAIGGKVAGAPGVSGSNGQIYLLNAASGTFD